MMSYSETNLNKDEIKLSHEKKSQENVLINWEENTALELK